MKPSQKLKIYQHAKRDYYRLASDFQEHRHYSFSQIKQYYQDCGEDNGYVFIIYIGIIKAYLIPYRSDCSYTSFNHTYALSHHLVIYYQQEEFDSLSIQKLQQKINFYKNAKK
ncbi:hypothetical protein [Longibaculum muris]|uniref:hypothetical protein n=1 Tax=Longibaculum muris TaxID=1796628 RepID=UPI0022E363E2|nr:hypothetical protein [Longibaculum muris]